MNVWSVRVDDSSVVVDELDAALSALESFYTVLRPYLRASTVVSLGEGIVERTDQTTEDRPARQITSSAGVTALPSMAAVCVTWRTTLAARRGMGRTFLGPLYDIILQADGSVEDGSLNAIRTGAQALVDDSKDSLTAWSIGVWGLLDPGAYDAQGRLIPGQPHVHRDITGFKIRDQFAALRSRRD